jgi:hypothetical protein
VFDWLTGHRKREELFAAEMVKAAAAGHKLAAIKSALSTLGVGTSERASPAFVAEAAAGLMRCVVTGSGRSTSEDDVLFSAGLFTFVAANHFSFEIAEPFEESASLALLELLGPADLARAHPAIVGAYNSMTQADSPTILAIGKTVARWAAKPSSENYLSLIELFTLCLEQVKPA